MQHLDWPFFEERHRTLARELDAWAHEHVSQAHGDDVDAQCKALDKDYRVDTPNARAFLAQFVTLP